MEGEGTFAHAVFRVAVILGGVFGAIGVIAAAGASHGTESRNLAAVASIALAHGPAMVALGLAARGRLFVTAAILLGVGTALFVADLGWREWQGAALFTGAAPIGGGAMIVGWIAVIIAGLIHRR